MQKKEAITLLGVGDIVIDQEQPETAFKYVVEVLRSGDITYANCEQALSDKGSPNPKQCIHSDPRNIPALLSAGIDVVSLANNHTQDWGKEALVDTMARLKEAGLPYVGVGNNLAEARQPVILERKGTRVGFLAYCCVGPEGLSYEAQHDIPGYAPVRSWTIYDHVDPQPGTWPRIISMPYKDELAAMVEDIKKLRTQVDVVVVCPHWGLHVIPRIIPMYCFDIGHAAVDAGADLILGTHTHVLKGIEIYHDKAIFYNTGDFIFNMGRGQRSVDNKQRYVSPRHVSDLKILYNVDPKGWEVEHKHSLIAKAVIEDGKIKRVSYIPCYLDDQLVPTIVKRSDPRGQGVFNYVEDVSRSEGLPTRFSWDGDEVLITP